jgi:hypothetical protein
MTNLHSELTNLLPRSSVRGLRRQYFVRLATVALGLGVVGLFVHSVLLFPSYLYTRSETKRLQAELDQLAASASSLEEKEINARIKSVQDDIAYLGRLDTQPAASAAVRALISVPRAGVTLSGFTYTAPTPASKEAQMTVTGTAATRDSLRLYVDSLKRLSFISKADLPISAYAKESQIPFTITLTGTFLP